MDHVHNVEWTGLDLILKDLVKCYLAAGHSVCAVSPHLYKFDKGYSHPEWCYQSKFLIPTIPCWELSRLNEKRIKFGTKALLKQARTDFFYRWILDSIKIFEPNVVHIHSADYWSLLAIAACEKFHLPFIVTLHGINKTNPMCDQAVIYDENFILNNLIHKARYITAVSWGTRQLMKEINPKLQGKIEVVLNGTDLTPAKNNPVFTRERYAVPVDAKVIVCVGTVGERKNQIALIEAFDQLTAMTKENIYLVIAGKDSSNGGVMNIARHLKCSNKVVFTGFVSHSDINQIYSIATLNVVASKSEGFGLSIIEAMRCGVPTLAYKGIDAYQDFKDLYSVDFFSSLDKEILSRSILNHLNRFYDQDRILKEGMNFGFTAVAEKYLRMLHKAAREN